MEAENHPLLSPPSVPTGKESWGGGGGGGGGMANYNSHRVQLHHKI